MSLNYVRKDMRRSRDMYMELLSGGNDAAGAFVNPTEDLPF